MGAVDLFSGNKMPLSKLITLKVDSKPVPVEGIENIIAMNIMHWGGGVTNLWD